MADLCSYCEWYYKAACVVRQRRKQSIVILPSRYPGRVAECCLSSAAVYSNLPVPMLFSPTALTGSQAEPQAPIQDLNRATAGGTRHRRAATEETYWAYSGLSTPLLFSLSQPVVNLHTIQYGQFGSPDSFKKFERQRTRL